MLARLAESLSGLAGPGSGGCGGGGGGGGAAAGEGGEGAGMASLVDSIMEQLLSKDVLYQPMKVWWGSRQGGASPRPALPLEPSRATGARHLPQLALEP